MTIRMMRKMAPPAAPAIRAMEIPLSFSVPGCSSLTMSVGELVFGREVNILDGVKLDDLVNSEDGLKTSDGLNLSEAVKNKVLPNSNDGVKVRD